VILSKDRNMMIPIPWEISILENGVRDTPLPIFLILQIIPGIKIKPPFGRGKI
jgi:hypothetical protein